MAIARSLRLIVPIVVGVLLLLGTSGYDDDVFPFGPFRMYSTKVELDDEVRALQLSGLDKSGEWTPVLIEEFGLRRADLEGQVGRHEVEPTVLLSELARTYRRLHDGDFPYVALQISDRVYDLEDGKVVGETSRIIGVWSAP